MPDIDPIEAPRALYRSITGREYQHLPLLWSDDLGLRLRPRLLFDQHKFASGIVVILSTEKTGELKWKCNLAIQVLVEAVVIPGLVVKE